MSHNIVFTNFENNIRYLNNTKGEIIVTFGPKSYIAGSRVECGNIQTSLLIGNYCSIAHEIVFVIGLNHDFRNITTYPESYIGSVDGNNITNSEGQEDEVKFNSYQISIGNDVWIGRGATLLSGIKIGNGAIIGANAVVAKDVPPYAVVVGNPGRVIKYRFDEKIIKKLQRIKWWYWDEEKIVKNKKLMKNAPVFVDRFYDLAMEKQIDNEMSKALKNLREDGYHLFYFIPDFEFKNEIWKKVIQKYLLKYSVMDKVALILEIKDECQYPEKVSMIYDWIQENGEGAPLVIRNSNGNQLPLDILQNIDTFITACAYDSVQCIDYGYDYGVKILSGLDLVIFE